MALGPGCRGWQPWLLATCRSREERGRVVVITLDTGDLPVTLCIPCLGPLGSSSKGPPKATLSSTGNLFSRPFHLPSLASWCSASSVWSCSWGSSRKCSQEEIRGTAGQGGGGSQVRRRPVEGSLRLACLKVGRGVRRADPNRAREVRAFTPGSHTSTNPSVVTTLWFSAMDRHQYCIWLASRRCRQSGLQSRETSSNYADWRIALYLHTRYE